MLDQYKQSGSEVASQRNVRKVSLNVFKGEAQNVAETFKVACRTFIVARDIGAVGDIDYSEGSSSICIGCDEHVVGVEVTVGQTR